MTGEFNPARLTSGTVLQAGVPKRQSLQEGQRANGLLMRGVVVATYVMDTSGHPAEGVDGVKPTAVYCDVLCYRSKSNQRWTFFPLAMVVQDRGALHSGRIWKPRATTMDITDVTVDQDKGGLLSNFDGDHVLVGFLDDNLSQPIVLGGVPHPSRDPGCEDWDSGHRMKLKLEDGDPDFWKHKGVYYGISKAGDFVVDTTRAFPGDELSEGGLEPVPPNDGTAGSYKVNLQKGAKLRVEIDLKKIDASVAEDAGAKPAVFEFDETGLTVSIQDVKHSMTFKEAALTLLLDGATLKSEGKDDSAKLTIGDGAKHVAIVEHLRDFYTNSIKAAWDSHTHPTGMGPSGPPVETPVMDPWDTSIESTKVSLPDN